MARPNAIPNTHLRDASRWALDGKDLPGSVSAAEQRSQIQRLTVYGRLPQSLKCTGEAFPADPGRY